MKETKPTMHWDGFTSAVAIKYKKLPPNVPARCLRAIYKKGARWPLDFLLDRLADRGDTYRLREWLRQNQSAIQKAFSEAALDQASCEWATFDRDGGHFHGTPNASYGYMYCIAWLDPKPEEKA